MNSVEFCGILKELHAKCEGCLSELDNCFKDMEVWKESVRDDVAKLLSNKKRKLIVPTTPAGVRKRVRLPVIEETVETKFGDADIILDQEKEVSVTFNVPRKTRSGGVVQSDKCDSSSSASTTSASRNSKNFINQSPVSEGRISTYKLKEVRVSLKKLKIKNRKSSRPSNKKSVSKTRKSKSLTDNVCVNNGNQTPQNPNISKEINANCISKDVNEESEANVPSPVVPSLHQSLDTQNSSSFVTATPLSNTYDAGNSTFNLPSSPSLNILDHENHASRGVNEESKTKSPVKTFKSPCLFSTYGNESVKKRVAAYENLHKTEEIKTTKRVTRSKARALLQNNSNSTSITHNNKHISLIKGSASNKPAAKKLLNKKIEVSKENSMLYSSKKTHFTAGSKVLSDVNRLHTSQSQLNSSKKTPMPRVILQNISSTGQVLQSVHTPIVTTMGTEGQVNITYKQSNYEIKKIDEFEKRKEKENEAIHRREELLKKKAEEQRRKKEERRLKVIQKREAQEKEKHENQLRAGRERDEKLNILLHERELKQKEEVLKKKLESERKAAEARRKVVEAEATRRAKLKMEEQIRKKELQEAEQLRLDAEEKEEALKREEVMKSKGAIPRKQKAPAKNLDSTVPPAEDSRNNTFTVPPAEDSRNNTFTVPPAEESRNNTFTVPPAEDSRNNTFTVPPAEDSRNNTFTACKKDDNNIYNLEDLSSEESGDDSDSDVGSLKDTALWANRSRIYWESRLDILLAKRNKIFGFRKFDISSVFTNLHNFKRTSSAQWRTPPRYSCLPHY